MLTHFDWLPEAVTHEVNADHGDANCPSKYVQEMPTQCVLVFFSLFFPTWKIMNFLNQVLELVTLPYCPRYPYIV